MVLIFSRFQAFSQDFPIDYYDSSYTNLQGGLGVSFTNLQFGQLYGLNGNLTHLRDESSIFFGLDVNYLLAFDHYEWPGIGKYRYNRSVICLSPIIGINLLKTNKFSSAAKFKANFAYFNGKLKTSQPILKEYILPSYSGQHFGFSIGGHVAYKITPKILGQIDIGYFRIEKQITYVYYNFGIAYNIKSKLD